MVMTVVSIGGVATKKDFDLKVYSTYIFIQKAIKGHYVSAIDLENIKYMLKFLNADTHVISLSKPIEFKEKAKNLSDEIQSLSKNLTNVSLNHIYRLLSQIIDMFCVQEQSHLEINHYLEKKRYDYSQIIRVK